MLGALRGSWCRDSSDRALEAREALSVEVPEPRCRGPSGLSGPRLSSRSVGVRSNLSVASDSSGSWCGRSSTGCRAELFGARVGGPARGVIVAQRAGTGKARKARAGRRSRRRERQVSVRECAGGDLYGPAAALAPSKGRAVNVMSVRVWGIRRGGPRSTWRSKKPEEGSGPGRGLTAELWARDSAWRKASKSRRLVCGSRFVGERTSRQRHGGSSS